ncbi:MAG: hypothetical protein WDO56_35925 [Gammaproteobacteria bacterium]
MITAFTFGHNLLVAGTLLLCASLVPAGASAAASKQAQIDALRAPQP